ncbi:MAG: rhomboid family intramembrane serine protease [Bacteroidales bacterium]|nr:MAG: rhomboid family intramembrane serine protease [Bacteroidales bacterium]
MNLFEEIKSSFKQGSTLIQLIYLNLGVFILVKIIQMFYILFAAPQGFESFIRWFAVPSYLPELIRKPWTLITYMFLHEGFLHILFNLLWLFWFGKIFLEYLDQKKLVSVYLLGGLVGAVLYIISFNVFPVFQNVVEESVALGASAAVIAVVIAIVIYVPNHTVYLLFIGPVKIKYIGILIFLVTSILDFSSNTGGKIAHIGGAILGFIYTNQYRKGKDIGRGLNRLLDRLYTLIKPRKKLKVTHKKPMNDYEYNLNKAKEQQEINRILDKISKGGYDSLTKEEKETLFKMSNKK